LAREPLHDCRVFRVERLRFERPAGAPDTDYFVLDAPDWVNVIPATDDGRIVLVRQYRVGVEAGTLEIPGGMCDPAESPPDAAARELVEETGCEAREIVHLGTVHPNPALQGNRCHSYLARGTAFRGAPSPSPHEIDAVLAVPAGAIPDLIRSGAITHALVIAAFHFLHLGHAPGPGGGSRP
jgi:8-oxo-dGTP pyrophosphatase MutT (NUDIX family)